MKSGLILLGLLLTVLGGITLAGEISSFAFPSEDEVEQALEAGEISYDDYLILSELLSVGLDSTNLYLLEQVSEPGLRLLSVDSAEQVAPIERHGRRVHGSIRHSYSQYLDEEGDVRYQTSIVCGIDHTITSQIKLKREYSGRERFVYRTVHYRSNEGRWEATLGNFSTRFGLGAVFGYRGKLLDYSTEINGESWLFPDYGGHNGLETELRANGWVLRGAYSVHRDSTYRLLNSAIMIQHTFGKVNAGLIAAFNRLGNRSPGPSKSDGQFSVWTELKSAAVRQSAEIIGQQGAHSGLAAAVTEGYYRFLRSKLTLLGWWYSAEFDDLAAGSKCGTVSRKEVLPEPSFSYYTHRSGQSGARMLSSIPISERLRYVLNAQISSLNHDSSDVQWSSEISGQLSEGTEVGLEFYQHLKRRIDNDPSFVRKNRWRASLRYRDRSVYFQQSMGYTKETSLPNRFSVLTRFRVRFPSYGDVELWSNISQGSTSTRRIETWYGFIRNQFLLMNDMAVDVKFGRYYHRNSLPKYRTAATCSLEYSL